jgi:hypothetical protein
MFASLSSRLNAGAWTFIYDITYDDPPGRQRPYDLSRCRRAAAASKPTTAR